MRLNGSQIGTLTEILVNDFSRSELRMLARVKLDIDLDDEVRTDEAWRQVAFEFIDTLDRRDRTSDLIRAIREARPRDATLIAFCDPQPDQANGVAQPASADALRKAIAAFNDGFQGRNMLFRYLNAYKRLHDVLHDLQSFLPTIADMVAKRTEDPSQPLADDVSIFLEDHIAIAGESVKDIEFPDRPPAWIARLVTAADVINGSEVQKMSRQVERLKTLPAEGLGPLNDKLFENASRLNPIQLIGSLDDILAALATDGRPAMTNLRGQVVEFRSLCSELHDLINAHNLCQTIDDAFHEAAGLSSVTPEELSSWGLAKKSLDELALQRKNDRRVSRTQEAAKLFEAANQGQAFRTLITRFDDLFMETDKALLNLTNKLLLAASTLNYVLEKFR
jgi:Effector-associated domain 1